LADEINANGGQALYTVADVADKAALQAAADKTVAEWGGFDTWVNNAGASVYGRIMDVPEEDFRRLFETNFWGVVNGSRIAVDHLRGKGGALINMGSEASDAPIPLQGAYTASKHAVKGFTDSLRMELEGDSVPVAVTLIKPTAIHTPFPEHAKNYLPYEPKLPTPVYAPELVAQAVLYCAEHAQREFFVGEMAKLNSVMAGAMPRLYEKMNESQIDSKQNSGKKAETQRPDSLYETHSQLRQRGAGERAVVETSVYQQAKLHPLLTGALMMVGGAVLAAKYTRETNSFARAKPVKRLGAVMK
jgi:NAD(P)-dependent dehydrogenase (short-subunit alcohol dehydrogenase family)